MAGTIINDDLNALLRIARPNLKETTIHNYMISIGKIHRTLNKNSEKITTECLRDSDKFTDYVSNLKSDNTKKNAYNIAVVFLMAEQAKPTINENGDNDNTTADLIKLYTKERDILNKKYTAFTQTHEKSVKQAENWLSYEELENIAKSYKNTDYQKYAILTFHLNIALRNDLQSIKVMNEKQYEKTEDKTMLNVIIKMTPKMKLKTGLINEDYIIYLNNYKTSGAYKEKIIIVPKILSPIIAKLIQLNINKENSYLVLNKGEAFKNNEFTRYFNKIIAHTGKKISTTLLRNIVLSHKYGDTVKEMKKVASDMCHSESTQKAYIKY